MKPIRCHQCGGYCNVCDWCEGCNDCNDYGKDRLSRRPFWMGNAIIFVALVIASLVVWYLK